MKAGKEYVVEFTSEEKIHIYEYAVKLNSLVQIKYNEYILNNKWLRFKTRSFFKGIVTSVAFSFLK